LSKILITGGAGYIGSHCVKKLFDSGFDCIVYDNLSRGHAEHVNWTPLIIGDVRDDKKLEILFKTHKFDAILHFAALAYVPESVKYPSMYWDNNFNGTNTLLNKALEWGINKVIFSSTCAVYGTPKLLPINEMSELLPINPYGMSKLACEKLIEGLYSTNNLKSVIFRYFNASGANHRDGLGEWHDPETHLIPSLIEAAIEKKPMKIFGSDFETRDGSGVRDYIHVEDIAKAHVLGLKFLLSGGENNVFNLGSSKGYSVLEIIKLVQKITGSSLDYELCDRRPGDPAELFASSSKAQSLLKWSPRFMIEEIINDSYLWYKIKKQKYDPQN
jgi:UDP-glucose-4-epimerase GalE